MLSRKGLILTLAGIFFATIIVTGTAVQGTAGGGPQPSPPGKTVVGPELSGEVTLVPGKKYSFKATLIGDGQEKVTITTEIPTAKPADTLSADEITRDATNLYVAKENYKLQDPKKVFKPASGNGDLIILEATGIQVTSKGGKMQVTGRAKVTYVATQQP